MNTLPLQFVERLKLLYPDSYESVLSFFSQTKPLSIRVNPLKTSVSHTLTALFQAGLQAQIVPWYEHAVIAGSVSAKILTELDLYKQGGFFIQSLSSMIPALILNPAPGDVVLDMAAAPGAKTSQMATLMKNKGTIIANDIDRNRIFKLKSILANQGVINTEIINIPGQSLWKKYPEYFDKVLLDVPCSMEGRFNTKDPKSYSHWSSKKVKNLAKLQKWMLRSALSSVKQGGMVVYSTCTLAPEENEEVVSWILEKEKGNVSVHNIKLKDAPLQNGLTSWKEKKFPSDLAHTKRIVPDGKMEGFFIAALIKTGKTVYRGDSLEHSNLY